MAVVRTRTSPPYALIAFIILWVISTGIAIYYGTQIGKAREEREVAQKALNEVVKEREKAELAARLPAGSAAANAPSVLSDLIKQIKDLHAIITGNPEEPTLAITNPGGVVAKTLQSVSTSDKITSSTPLLAALKLLRTEVDAAKAETAQIKQTLKATEETNRSQLARFEEDRKKVATAVEEAKENIKALQTQLDEAKQKHADAIAEREKTVTAMTETADRANRESQVAMAEKNAQIQRLKNNIDNLRRIIEDLRPRATGKVIAKANGTIIRTNNTNNECYINLGRVDRVVPGLTFSVHDPRLGIQTDAAGAKGKAGIEVIDVGERESLCRITHLEKNQRLQSGDLIYNIVFTTDKTRPLHFAVYGAFDLKGDGHPTAAEREKIVKMIQDWGGVIDDLQFIEETDKAGNTKKVAALSPQTDYVVLGTAPKLPQGVKISDLDEVSKERYKALSDSLKEYERLESEAKRSSVPILNANRFLNMVGYYNTTLVRY